MRLSLLSPNFTRKSLFLFMRDTLRILPVFMDDCRRLAFLSRLDSTVTHTSSVTCFSVPLSVPTVFSDTRFNRGSVGFIRMHCRFLLPYMVTHEPTRHLIRKRMDYIFIQRTLNSVLVSTLPMALFKAKWPYIRPFLPTSIMLCQFCSKVR